MGIRASRERRTKVHLRNVTLAPISTLGQVGVPSIETLLFLEVLADDQLVTRSEPSSCSGTELYWLFDIESQIPESSSSITIDIKESAPDQDLDFTFDPTSITLEDVVSASEDKRHASLAMTVNTSVNRKFRLRANLTILELLVYPLDVGSIRTMCNAIRERESLANIHDLIILYNSVKDLDVKHTDRATFLDLVGDGYMEHYRKTHRIEHLDKAADAYKQALQTAPSNDKGILYYLSDYGCSLLERYGRLGELSDLDIGIAKIREATQHTLDSHSSKPLVLQNLGASLLTRFERLGDLADLEESIAKKRDAVWLTPDSDPSKPARLSNLGNSQLRRFERLGDLRDLEESIAKSQEAVRLTPDTDQHRSTRLSNLGTSLLIRYERLGELSDLEESIAKTQEAVRLTPDSHPDKPSWLSNLGGSLLTRFERLGELADLEESICKKRKAVRLTPDGVPDKSSRLNNLGISLATRFERLGELSDLEDSIAKQQEAVRLIPNGHPDKLSLLNNLAMSLHNRFLRLGELGALEDSIAKSQEAVQLTPDDHPDKAIRLNSLGNSLFTRYERVGDLADLENAITKIREAVQLTPDSHPRKLSRLNSLGISFRTRFLRLGDLSALQNSITSSQEAVRLTPNDHPDKPSWLNNLAVTLLTRYDRLGEPSDLEESITINREAVRLTPDGHPQRPFSLSSLGNSLFRRYERVGEIADVEESIVKNREALKLTPDDHPDKPLLLSTLGNSLFKRYERFGESGDLEEAVAMQHEAVRLTPNGHFYKPTWLSNLGSTLRTRFRQLGELTDLDESIAKSREAVHLTPDDRADKLSFLINLGSSLLNRFERLEEIGDLAESITTLQDTVRLAPDGHPLQPLSLTTLGCALTMRSMKLKSDDYDDLSEVSLALRSVTCSECGAPSDRFRAARAWAMTVYLLQRSVDLPFDVLEPCRIAILLISELAWLGSSLSDRHYQIREISDFLQLSVSVAFEAGQPALAVEWLEQGRSIAWSQYLQLRTPLDELSSAHPTLGQQFKRISLQLEKILSQRHLSATNGLRETSVQDLIQLNHQLVRDRRNMLAAIRERPGFERFLLPRTIGDLAAAATQGPVVVLVSSVGDNVCYAVIFTPDLADDVITVKLESFSPRKALRLYTQLKCILQAHGRGNVPGNSSDSLEPKTARTDPWALDKSAQSERTFRKLIIGFGSDSTASDSDEDGDQDVTGDTFPTILAKLWNGVAKPVLDALAITTPPSQVNTRLWWCPTGILTFLPLHAAGLYHRESPCGSKLSDYVISSYTPTVSTLLSSKKQSSPPAPLQLLAVAQPSSDRQRYISGTLKEVAYVQEAVAGTLSVTTLTEKDATIERVTSELPTSNWVHFACHGVQDPAHPTESALLLAGTDRLSLADLSNLHIPHGDLAFLSACQTATGNENLSDEAVHLGAGMLVAGYRGVVATMWSVSDDVAPQVARNFYKHLVASGADSSEAARALHLAVKRLQESKESDDEESLMSWVPFIHLGR